MERIDMMWEPVRAILLQVGEFFPRVLLAIVILIIGWLVAKALRFAAVKALRARTEDHLRPRPALASRTLTMRFPGMSIIPCPRLPLACAGPR